jgi:hypothetical protein
MVIFFESQQKCGALYLKQAGLKYARQLNDFGLQIAHGSPIYDLMRSVGSAGQLFQRNSEV